MARIVVLGAGFAGLWAAIGAARTRDEIGRACDIDIHLIDRNPFHNIRVRNYEVDLSEAVIPLPQLLDPIGVSSARSRPSIPHGARSRWSRAAARKRWPMTGSCSRSAAK